MDQIHHLPNSTLGELRAAVAAADAADLPDGATVRVSAGFNRLDGTSKVKRLLIQEFTDAAKSGT